MSPADKIDAVVAARNFGEPSAAKRGRTRLLPFVPIIDYGEQEVSVYRTRTYQPRGYAFATRAEAIDCARRMIDAARAKFREDLQEPRCRALREQFGLPREVRA